MKRQLFFALPKQSDNKEFLVSNCNREAVQWIERWPDWGNLGLIIYGASSSGKTHLLSLWSEKANAIQINSNDLTVENTLKYKDIKSSVNAFAVDNVDQIIADTKKATALFHLYNLIRENNGYLLLTASKPIASWNCTLLDLSSRLKTIPSVSILSPDEEILQRLLVKFFSDYQLRISPDVISYIMKHTERSFIAIEKLVEKLNKESLSQKRAITIPLVRSIIEEIQENC